MTQHEITDNDLQICKRKSKEAIESGHILRSCLLCKYYSRCGGYFP